MAAIIRELIGTYIVAINPDRDNTCIVREPTHAGLEELLII